MLHQSLETKALQQLHCIKEVALFRHTEVVDSDSVNGAECGCFVRFSLEAPREHLTGPMALAEQGLSGVGPALAQRLLIKFGSVERVVTADEEAWRRSAA